jgi:hypothetical protein
MKILLANKLDYREPDFARTCLPAITSFTSGAAAGLPWILTLVSRKEAILLALA